MKCFKYYAKSNKNCGKKNCRYWISSSENSNCAVNVIKKGPQTLQTIGEIYGITRMRVCQIEKTIIRKLKKRVSETLS
jgi:hypothetical protein